MFSTLYFAILSLRIHLKFLNDERGKENGRWCYRLYYWFTCNLSYYLIFKFLSLLICWSPIGDFRQNFGRQNFFPLALGDQNGRSLERCKLARIWPRRQTKSWLDFVFKLILASTYFENSFKKLPNNWTSFSHWNIHSKAFSKPWYTDVVWDGCSESDKICYKVYNIHVEGARVSQPVPWKGQAGHLSWLDLLENFVNFARCIKWFLSWLRLIYVQMLFPTDLVKVSVLLESLCWITLCSYCFFLFYSVY